MGSISYTIPTAGSTLNSIADPEIASALQTLLTWANGNVDGANVAATLTGRRLVAQAAVFIGASFGAAALYQIAADGSLSTTGSSLTKPPMFWVLDPANFQVTGKSNTQLVLRTSYACGIAPGITVSTELNAVSGAGGSGGAIALVQGSLAGSGSGNALNSNGLVGSYEGAAFTFPTAGAYYPLVQLSGATAANSATSLLVQLFVLNN
jgi:hypothetical protein